MDNEKSSTLSGWSVGPNAFGLYLVLGIILALLITGVYGVFYEGSITETAGKASRITSVEKRSEGSGIGAGSVRTPVRSSTVIPIRK